MENELKVKDEPNDETEIIEVSGVEIVDETDKLEVLEVLDKDAAKQLTKDIQSTTTALYVLLKKAHDTKAWLSLGYKTWTEYIEKEFDFSRARSYQLINQANVIEEINDASGVPLYITEREARSIKKRLPEITEKLKDMKKDEDLSEDEVREVIEEQSIEDIDNSTGFEGESSGDGWDNPEDYEEKGDEDNSVNSSRSLSEENKFLYENLLITLEIFETLPSASSFGKTIKYSNEDKKKLIKLAENSFSWITQLLEELE